MEFQYQLKAEEAEESLLCLAFRTEGKWKYIHEIVLSVIVVSCLLRYWMNPEISLFLLLGGASIILLFGLLYIPGLRRKRKAKGFAKGYYKVKIPKENLKKGFESEKVFTFQTDQEIYCIPKRILNGEQEEDVRRHLQKHADKVFKVTAGREH